MRDHLDPAVREILDIAYCAWFDVLVFPPEHVNNIECVTRHRGRATMYD